MIVMSGLQSCSNCSTLVSTIRKQLEAFKIIGGLEESLSSTLLVVNLEKIVGQSEDDLDVKEEVTSSRETIPDPHPFFKEEQLSTTNSVAEGSSSSPYYYGKTPQKNPSLSPQRTVESPQKKYRRQSKRILEKKSSHRVNTRSVSKMKLRGGRGGGGTKSISHQTKKKPVRKADSNLGPHLLRLKRAKLTRTQKKRATIEQVDQEIGKVRDGFRCLLCDKKFGKRMVIVTHVRSFHFNERAECSGCAREFYRISDVRRHQKSSGCGR